MNTKQDIPLSKIVRDRRFNELRRKREEREAKIAAAKQQSIIPTGSVGGLGSASLDRETLLARAKERRDVIEQNRALSEQDRRLIQRMTAALEANTAVLRRVHGLEVPEDTEEELVGAGEESVEAEEESSEAETGSDAEASSEAPEAS